ncbi:MAG TPA: hypothetical protein VGA58_06780 [bacterium]
MKTQRLVLALTGINLVLLLLNLVQARSTTAQTVSPILRARALELVDERNVVRVRLNVKDSELNLFDKNGIIRVKLGAGEDGSGLVLSEGGTDASRGYVQIIARQTGTAARPTTTSITLRASAGRQRVITPP